ncbi:MAG: hypothetical protein EOP92_19050 [Lysobacteraceae bacterium]|nr:MAG: hypothetical protein EOP92_19050 [Xanthomonadaceae bacterium]
MKILAMGALLTALALASFDAAACRTNPPMKAPVYSELAKFSDMVAIVHIERIRPLSPEDEALNERLWTDPPMNVPIQFPTTSAEFSTLRMLKGKAPEQFLIRNGATNCDVQFVEGKDYLVFARWPDPSSEIVPDYGTFPLDESQHSLAALAAVESSLSLPNSAKP